MGHHDLDLGAVARLDDVALMVGLQRLVRQDRALTARLLLHLGEVEARGLYREQAFSSMFEYAVEALRKWRESFRWFCRCWRETSCI